MNIFAIIGIIITIYGTYISFASKMHTLGLLQVVLCLYNIYLLMVSI